MLSTYSYNLLTRRFIQFKFQQMTFDPVSNTCLVLGGKLLRGNVTWYIVYLFVGFEAKIIHLKSNSIETH